MTQVLWLDSSNDHIRLLRFAICRLEIYGPDLCVVVFAGQYFVTSNDFSILKGLFGDDLPAVSGFLPHARDDVTAGIKSPGTYLLGWGVPSNMLDAGCCYLAVESCGEITDQEIPIY